MHFTGPLPLSLQSSGQCPQSEPTPNPHAFHLSPQMSLHLRGSVAGEEGGEKGRSRQTQTREKTPRIGRRNRMGQTDARFSSGNWWWYIENQRGNRRVRFRVPGFPLSCDIPYIQLFRSFLSEALSWFNFFLSLSFVTCWSRGAPLPYPPAPLFLPSILFPFRAPVLQGHGKGRGRGNLAGRESAILERHPDDKREAVAPMR
jgi:hypothetical protein